MRNTPLNLGRIVLSVATAWTIAFGAGCAMPKPSGFLGNYSQLKRANDSTWRYVDAARLATYDKYMVSSVKVLVKSYNGTPLTPEQQEQVADRLRGIIVTALFGRRGLVVKPAGKTAEIRAAITAAYPVGQSLMLGMEGEIVDAFSGQQLAALVKYQAGPPQSEAGPATLSNDTLGGEWWNTQSAVWVMEQWAEELRKAMEKMDEAKIR